MLISKFEKIKMLEDDTFGEIYSKMSDLRNQMVSLGKTVLDVKLIRKILRSLPEHFKIKVTTIEESKDLEEMKIEELVGSLQTYDLSLLPVKKLKTIALKASKKMVEVSSGDDFEDEEKDVVMLAKIFGRLMRNERFKKKFSEKMKKVPREAEPEEAEKKDPRGQDVLNAQGLGISGLIVGISSKARGRLITRLSMMSLKKKKLLSKRNF
jgi:RNA-binding protein YhbY